MKYMRHKDMYVIKQSEPNRHNGKLRKISKTGQWTPPFTRRYFLLKLLLPSQVLGYIYFIRDKWKERKNYEIYVAFCKFMLN